VDEYADLMRFSVASAGNDHRLGANEAPPAIISIFLGDELTAVVEAIEKGEFFGKSEKVRMEMGAAVIPHFTRDTTDRNRTSPFAFTGNKFEFRSLGSAASVADPNIILNTAVAEILKRFADQLEKVEGDRSNTIHTLIRDTFVNHKRVIFNGNGYSQEWVDEAKKRGLYNFKSTPDVLPVFLEEKNRKLFSEHGIYNQQEIESRHEIKVEIYCKTLHIEAKTLVDMLIHEFLPAVSKYTDSIADSILKRRQVSDIPTESDETRMRKLVAGYEELSSLCDELKEEIKVADATNDLLAQARYYHDHAEGRAVAKSVDESLMGYTN
jgi:hypothetical protein